MSRTLLVDFQNLVHRCKSQNGGEHAFIFRFVRSMRLLIEETKADAVVIVRDGSPKHRYDLYAEYKGHRKLKKDDPKLQEKMDEVMNLKRQADEAVAFCLKNLEVSVVKHSNLEADDVIANLARRLVERSDASEVVVASTDKDFAQLLYPKHDRIHVWNPSKKEYLSAPEYDPVVYKALCGDKSDNIPGVPGFGPKKAARLATVTASSLDLTPNRFDALHDSETYQRNLKLVRFYDMKDEDWNRVSCDNGKYDAGGLMVDFVMFGFATLTEEKAWNRMNDTFGAVKRANL